VHRVLFELLETAQRKFERDREAAKASLTTASSILQLEINRRSCAKDTRHGAAESKSKTQRRS
jgi:AraC family transcriptional regulator